MSYSVNDYLAMIADQPRVAAYAEALRAAVKPGMVVLEIGAGLGFFALLACRLGARRVYAIEPNDATQVAREIAAANGYADRIEFIQELSTKVTLPECADVIVSDLRGLLPLYQTHLPSLIDARQRLLAPGGVLIPQRDTLWVAVVEAADLYQQQARPRGDDNYGFDLEPARRISLNIWRKGRVKPEQILLGAQLWGALDYATVTDPDLRGEAAWMVERAGTAHGLLVWFEATLAAGVHFSNAPSEPELIYGSAFFPWTAPVELAPGDAVQVRLQADLVDDDYVWRWETTVSGQSQPQQVKASFRQATFFGRPLSPVQLRKGAASFRPALNDEGRCEQFILAQMDGQTSLQEIAERAAAQFPQRFKSGREALTLAGKLAQKYSS